MLWALLLIPFASTYWINRCPNICVCDSGIINCQDLDLNELPEEIDKNVTDLDLSINDLRRVPSEIKTFLYLRYLNLSHNRISTLMSTDFSNLKNLETLDLSFNLFHDWRDIHSSSFRSTLNLKWLDFSSNPLRSINNQSNHLNIKSLIILRLTNCSMITIPVPVFNRLINLRELHLSANPIVSINESFQLNDLRFVDLSRCSLNHIDENVFTNLVNLEALNLRQNSRLKRVLCHSEHITHLDLSECILERVPTGRLGKVKTLDLSTNYIKTIPANGFKNFDSLEVLNLSTNAITAIDEKAFQDLNEVRSIDLSFNKLTALSENLFSNNTALLNLNLSHNYIRVLDNINSGSLKMLIVNYCEIHEMNKYSLMSLPNLVTLFMSRNFISSLPDGLIADNLGILDVSSCRIKSLNNKTFAKMFYLRQINLANNALTHVDPSYFPRAFNVIINDNPWRCDCPNLKRMFEWVTVYESEQRDDLICDSPEKYAGKSWQEACTEQWYPSHAARETMWYYSVTIIALMVVALFGVIILRKIKDIKEERLRAENEARRTEERETLRMMQERAREQQEEEDRNAPDPRELQRPPSYTEAMLLPPINASQPNLAGSLHSLASRPSLGGSNPELSKKRRKRLRRKSEEERRASRMTLDSDSSGDNAPPRRRPPPPGAPLESDF
ncbi:chaoptin [Sitophilus oryzae]|uniref:Chaoptin n=1 Tax=Sitophilus oryzae TaxID=7048 RepID=A0A6J2Y036_SITOR|nr:chaoptin [Sitophilus oryzae]